MTATRRDPSRRVTPERMAFYRKRAKQLRDEAIRETGRALWARLMKALRWNRPPST